MTMDKKKLPVRRLDPPRWLVLRREFAFISRYPLDECARRIRDVYQQGDWLYLIVDQPGSRATSSGLWADGMDDLHFALRLREQGLLEVWSAGALYDVKGEWTWVRGAYGVTPVYIVTYVIWGLILGLALGGLLAFCFTHPVLRQLGLIAGLAITASGFLRAQRRIFGVTNRRIREVFGIRGEGPLPVDDPPAEVVERAS